MFLFVPTYVSVISKSARRQHGGSDFVRVAMQTYATPKRANREAENGLFSARPSTD